MNLGSENEYQEFKESLGQLDKGLKSLSAMLNKHGQGAVYFGVDDNGEVCGLTIGKETLMDIRNRIRDKIEPRVYAEISECKANDKKYIKVSASGSDIPYCFDGRYYIRNVSADEQANNEILRKMLSSSDSDVIRQMTSPKQDLTFKSLFTLLLANGKHPKDSEEFYSNYGLLNRDGKFNLNAYLLNSININKINFDGIVRKEESLFDFASFREAWINACLHNDWKNAIAPSIYMFDDRVEIVSYGGLPFSLSKEGFYSGTSVPVNKSLLTVFMAAGYVEQSGHGIPTIVDKYGKDVFSFDDGCLKVTIPLSFERADVLQRKEMLLRKNGLTLNQKAVYETLDNDGRLSLNDVATMTGLSPSGVKKICDKLQKGGLLRRKGSKKDGVWLTK